MSTVWIYQNLAEIEEFFSGGQRILDSGVNPNTIRIYSEDRESVPFTLLTSDQEKKINPREEVIVVKGGDEYRGNLLSITEHIVTLILPDFSRLFIRDYDQVISTNPTIINPIVSSSEPGYLKYQTTNLHWRCLGDLFLDSSNRISNLSLYALVNQTQDISNNYSRIVLVSGNIPQPSQPPAPRSVAMAMSERGPAYGEGDQESFGDYQSFLITGPLVEGSNYLPLLTTKIPDNKRVYFYSLYSGSSPSRVGYIFDSPIDLPGSEIKVHDASGMFLGATSFPEKRKGQSVRLYLGETTKILPKTHLTTEQLPIPGHEYWSRTRVSFVTQVKSSSSEAEIAIARYYVGKGKITSITCSGQGRVTDDGYLEFILSVPPGQEASLNCTFTIEP